MEPADINASLVSIKSELAAHGFLLCDAQSVNNLPDSVWLEPSSKPESHGSLLLIGHAGKKFWESFSKVGGLMQKSDPVDSYCVELTQKILEEYLPQVPKQLLFPMADCPVNLMALGRAFNWHTPSPLGMGIHAEYGLWSAYRAVWWLDLELPDDAQAYCESVKHNAKSMSVSQVPTQSLEAKDICAKCLTQDCVVACPTEAVNYSKNPNLSNCADYRLEDNSQCESSCMARMACPHAAEHRYTEPQMRYHYDLARSAIIQYRSKS